MRAGGPEKPTLPVESGEQNISARCQTGGNKSVPEKSHLRMLQRVQDSIDAINFIRLSAVSSSHHADPRCFNGQF